MYKNQLQELAQRSCFNLPSYSCIREGPDHAPRFKATVNFNGDTFESPTFCSTLRQAEHAAAEVALNTLANRGPSRALAARILDETGVYKNLLQETAHRAGLNLPVYTTVRSGPGHVPVFSCTVELAGMSFSGEPAKTKKQAQKNAAMTAWSALKQLAQRGSSSSASVESESCEELEQVVIARVLANLQPTESNNKKNDHQDGRQRSNSTHGNLNPPAPSLCPMQFESWAYSNFSSEIAMYQMWQQAQLSQLQSRVLALPVPPALPPSLHVLPRMQSVFQPDHNIYFPVQEQEPAPVGPGVTFTALRPSFYMASHSIPGPIRGRSMVSIQEIQEEKTEESSSRTEVLNPPILGDHKTQPMIQKPAEEKKQKSGGLEAKIEGSGQTEGNPARQFEWVPPRSKDSGYRPVGFQSSQSNHRPYHPPRASSHGLSRPPSTAAHVLIRNVGPASSLGPIPQNVGYQIPVPLQMRAGVAPCSTRAKMEFGGLHSRFAAPAVQIRSVVPVCSAPPTRKMQSSSQVGQSSNQVGQSSNQEVKNTGKEDVPAVSAELSKLQM
ncbi:double-stranded RNA-binding protein 3-like [Cornus florida]|uniref:double-stranded RNA-binding protein 3-like n=1 Tax=Cornus florida TaxID=4283 RepID=UPI0028989C5A|nr:double-stranded RNA-binding protein 3-like [Cornus florida]